MLIAEGLHTIVRNIKANFISFYFIYGLMIIEWMMRFTNQQNNILKYNCYNYMNVSDILVRN